jgi:hypothetical protein
LAQQKTPSAGQRVPPATAPASKEQRGDAPFVALPLIAQSDTSQVNARTRSSAVSA